MSIQLKIKKLHPNARIPEYATDGSAGMDLVAIECAPKDNKLICDTGLAMSIPNGYVGLLFPRSSVHKKDLRLANSVGVIDSDYRGPVKAIFKLTDNGVDQYKPGDRVCQMIIVKTPQVLIQEVEKLDDTERGDGGFGSTGN